jgi:hypothetical protein
LNQQAIALLRAEHRLVIAPGASYLFDEPGKLVQVAARVVEWLQQHLTASYRAVQ